MKNTGNRYDIVSSMSIDYFHRWGAYMCKTFLGNWHPNFTMTLYSEDLLPIDNQRIKVVSLDMFGKELKKHLVITRGDKGAILIHGDKVIEISAKKNLKIVDLTGAGDLFAAGYLHGVINNLSTQDSLNKGTELSSKIIQKIGARL